MARGTIFITNYTTRKEIKDSYWYCYLEEDCKKILRVYKHDEQVHTQEASIGDAFEVIIKGTNNENVFITPMIPPRKDWEAIAWLLGFGKNERASTYKQYIQIRDRKRLKMRTQYIENILDGPNFEFGEFSLIGGEDTGYHNMACWVGENITHDEIIRLIPEFIYPEPFVRRVLKERFNVTEEEFENALDVFD